MKIIPALDIIDGKCVRLYKGDYNQKTEYKLSPLEVAKSYEEAGLKHLHLVDLDGAKAGEVVNWEVVQSLCSQTQLAIDFGGGAKTTQHLERLFELGVKQVTVGSMAVQDPEQVAEWIKTFGAERLILGADVLDGSIRTKGWTEDSGLQIGEFLRNWLDKGFKYVICTDVSKDGAFQGPSTDLYREIITTFPQVRLIASGGVTELSDLPDLQAIGCHGAIVGKALYENRITVEELSSLSF
ncbi:MAG: 1-(5-phosphoribosyl)-5-[(5-phosphoribosylamino)methylideneamino]imidazole-4-carboxamide isomerase [Cyclobacteriaceae bacterium]|nr:1-(5-phosphoribosyl)-5-[(5-phosphoribosylamino)methylideneamino]imidazole-4-carboxamide isomerase [Cyclobacteriaceae bacterium]MCH8516004.1 1-(5-phosphoribosyl)-5-[(5-phosphoribosylamino)methylideneamino]imidazole-4-carboxamide isomerase [Cyclobacteriaceae bacterium]